MPTRHFANMPVVVMTVFLDALGFGIIFPVLPDLMRRFTTDAAEVGVYAGYFLSVYAAMEFIASPVLGMLSDHYGRRPVLLLSLAGSALDLMFMAFAPSLTLLLLGRLISGITAANTTVAWASVADTSTPESRSTDFAKLQIAASIGIIFGPLLGGYFGRPESWLGPATPFFVAAVFTGINFLFGLFILPESLTPENRRAFSWTNINPVPAIFRSFKRPELVMILTCILFYHFAERVNEATWALYNHEKFGWTPQKIGYSFAFVGVFHGLTSYIGIKYLIPAIGERRAARFALLVYAISLLGFAFASQGWMVYFLIVPYTFSAMVMPILVAEVSRVTQVSERGEMQGVLTSLRSLTMIVGPLFYGILWKVTFSRFVGANYLTAGLVAVCAWYALVRTQKSGGSDL